MKKTIQIIAIIIVILFGTNNVFAQYPNYVKYIKSVPNGIVQAKGNLNQGRIISDLSWASRSSVACFPATQNAKFRGNHVLYWTKLPQYSEMYIKLIPKNKNLNMSLYAYSVGVNNYSVPPKLYSCVSCEADHKWDRPQKGKTQDHTRSVYLNAVNSPFNVVIGVVGSGVLREGDFTIEIKLKSRVQNNATQKPLKAFSAKSEKGKVMSYGGDLSQGVKINNLRWASTSSMACFPATQNHKFTGNHVIFLTDLPRRSEMTITLIPEDKNANMSLYAYSAGSHVLPTKVSRCVSCEADHKWDRPKRGRTQDHTRTVKLNGINPYKVVIGVAGADGLSKGRFRLDIKVK